MMYEAALDARSNLLGSALRAVSYDVGPSSEDEAIATEERLALAAKAYTEEIDKLPTDQQPLDWNPDLDKEMEEL